MCELEWNRALLTMALISGAVVCMQAAFEPQEDVLNIVIYVVYYNNICCC